LIPAPEGKWICYDTTARKLLVVQYTESAEGVIKIIAVSGDVPGKYVGESIEEARTRDID